MAGLREFVVQFGTEEQCIEHLAGLRWPGGFACSGCGGRQAWRLKTRPRVYECATCHRQESATAGTVFHRTRTDLTKWFLAAYLMGCDKRGVSDVVITKTLLGGGRHRGIQQSGECGRRLGIAKVGRHHDGVGQIVLLEVPGKLAQRMQMVDRDAEKTVHLGRMQRTVRSRRAPI
jgi:hypothetical protein